MAVKKLTLVSALVLGAGTAVAAPIVLGSDGAVVTNIVDGDTIDVPIGDKMERIRLLNIDTPEIGRAGKPSECLATDARDFLADLLPLGSSVTLKYDEERQDRYGRTLAVVYHNDALANARIAAEGLAVAIKIEPNVKFYPEVSAAADEARNRNLGVFGTGPECFVSDQDAMKQLENLTSSVDDSRFIAIDVDADLDEARRIHAELGTMLKALKKLARQGLEQSEFKRVAYGAKLQDRVEKAIHTAELKQKRLTEEIEHGEGKLREMKAREEEARREAQRMREAQLQRELEEAERLEALRMPPAVAPPAYEASAQQDPSASRNTPQPPSVSVPSADTYTGCRAYGGNYALTSIDKKGRPYAKIDCTTKAQIG